MQGYVTLIAAASLCTALGVVIGYSFHSVLQPSATSCGTATHTGSATAQSIRASKHNIVDARACDHGRFLEALANAHRLLSLPSAHYLARHNQSTMIAPMAAAT